MTRLIPLDNRVLIKPDEREDTYHGIIHLPNMGKEKPTTGTIVALGDNVTLVKKGEKVLFGKYAGVTIDLNDSPHHMVREDDLLATIEEE